MLFEGLDSMTPVPASRMLTGLMVTGYTRFVKWDHYPMAANHLPEDNGYPFLYVVEHQITGCDISMT